MKRFRFWLFLLSCSFVITPLVAVPIDCHSQKSAELQKFLISFYGIDSQTTDLICSKFDSIPATDAHHLIDEFLEKAHNFPLSSDPKMDKMGVYDAMNQAVDYHTILFENNQIRILWGMTKAGEEEPFHTHQWQSLMVILQGSTFRIENSDGSIEYGEWPIGVYELPTESTPSAYTNIGSSDFKNLRFEIK